MFSADPDGFPSGARTSWAWDLSAEPGRDVVAEPCLSSLLRRLNGLIRCKKVRWAGSGLRVLTDGAEFWCIGSDISEVSAGAEVRGTSCAALITGSAASFTVSKFAGGGIGSTGTTLGAFRVSGNLVLL